MNGGYPRLALAARILFWSALIFAFVMATLLKPPPALPDGPIDKVQHMLAFGVLTLLMGLGWPRLTLWRMVIAMALFGALIEIVQLIPVLHRMADIADWWANMGAVTATLLLVALVRTGLHRRSPDPRGVISRSSGRSWPSRPGSPRCPCRSADA